MNKLIAWWGIEKEGLYRGAKTLFIRGGFERMLVMSMESCHDRKLGIDQVYFGAGSTRAEISAVLNQVDYISKKVRATVEIGPDQAHEIPTDFRLTIMLNIVVPRLEGVFLKKRTDKELAVGVTYLTNNFDDVDGKYADDIPLLWSEDDN